MVQVVNAELRLTSIPAQSVAVTLKQRQDEVVSDCDGVAHKINVACQL